MGRLRSEHRKTNFEFPFSLSSILLLHTALSTSLPLSPPLMPLFFSFTSPSSHHPPFFASPLLFSFFHLSHPFLTPIIPPSSSNPPLHLLILPLSPSPLVPLPCSHPFLPPLITHSSFHPLPLIYSSFFLLFSSTAPSSNLSSSSYHLLLLLLIPLPRLLIYCPFL